MTCEKIEQLLSPYLEGELRPEEKRAVDKHLQACSRCSELFSFLKEAKVSLSDFPEVDLSENLLARLQAIPARKKRFRLSFDFMLRPSFQPILAAATVLLTFLSFYLFNPNKSAIDKSVDREFHRGLSKVEMLYAKAESFTSSLGEYKDNILVSLKNVKLFRGTED